MKKSYLFIIAILFVSIAWSQDKTVLTIDNVNTTDLKPGDKITVHIHFQSPEKELSSFQLYLMYDQEVLSYQEITNVHPLIKDAWHDNQTPNFIAALYLDSQQKGIHFDGYNSLFDIVFIYNGGETDIQWGTESKIVDDVMLSGVTKFTTSQKTDAILELNNGCVCPVL